RTEPRVRSCALPGVPAGVDKHAKGPLPGGRGPATCGSESAEREALLGTADGAVDVVEDRAGQADALGTPRDGGVQAGPRAGGLTEEMDGEVDVRVGPLLGALLRVDAVGDVDVGEVLGDLDGFLTFHEHVRGTEPGGSATRLPLHRLPGLQLADESAGPQL